MNRLPVSVIRVVWAAVVILEKYFGNIWDALHYNIVANGRIVIYKDRDKIFIQEILRYNDTCRAIGDAWTVACGKGGCAIR